MAPRGVEVTMTWPAASVVVTGTSMVMLGVSTGRAEDSGAAEDPGLLTSAEEAGGAAVVASAVLAAGGLEASEEPGGGREEGEEEEDKEGAGLEEEGRFDDGEANGEGEGEGEGVVPREDSGGGVSEVAGGVSLEDGTIEEFVFCLFISSSLAA